MKFKFSVLNASTVRANLASLLVLILSLTQLNASFASGISSPPTLRQGGTLSSTGATFRISAANHKSKPSIPPGASPKDAPPPDNSPDKPSSGENKPANPSSKVVIKPPAVYIPVSPLELLHDPDKYIDKGIAFEGTFNTFSGIGLDYKKAFRNSTDFITLLINRPDVTGHTIPLSELKLFYPRKDSEAVLHLDSGDKIAVKGKVFSTALGDAWVDVLDLKILTPKKPVEKKAAKKS